MDKLKELLGDLWTAALEAKLGTTKILIDDGTWIPKHRFDEVNDAKKASDAAARKSAADLEALKASAVGNETLTKQITDLQAANAKAEEKRQLERKATAVRIALMDAGVGDPAARELLEKSFDMGKVELDEAGKPKEFDKHLEPIKANKTLAGLFGEKRIAGQQHAAGDNPPPASAGDLQVALAAAQKAGRLSEVIAIKRKISDAANAAKVAS